MRSMTGFGQAADENERFRVTVTLRGVNHRFLDLVLRLRDDLRVLEPELRELLAGELKRGRLEVSLEVELLEERRFHLELDEPAVKAVQELHRKLCDRGLLSGSLSFSDLMRLPEVVRIDSRGPQWDDTDRAFLIGVVERALGQLVAARSLEGGHLHQALEQRITSMKSLTAELKERSAELPKELARALQQRVTELLSDQPFDADRLAQEVVLLVDRSDISEELDRLASHLDHFSQLIDEPGSLGKRLDFLTQEIFRELNTVGTKGRDTAITRSVLDAKVLCEQLREQIQNVE